jgi:hypothetical protein
MLSLLKDQKKIKFIFLGIIIILIFWRFYRLTELGIVGNDVFFYWQTAYDWLNGDLFITEHFRPLIYWLHMKTMWLLGVNDWSIKALHLSMDASIALVLYCLGLKIRKSHLVGFFASMFYLSLFYSFENARTEVVHIPSSFFITLSVLFMTNWFRTPSHHSIFLVGVFHSCAWHVHPDLAVLGLPFVIFISLKIFISSKVSSNERVLSLFKMVSIYVLGYFLVFFVFTAVFGLDEMLDVLKRGHGAQNYIKEPFLIRFWVQGKAYLLKNFGMMATLIVLSTILLFIKKKFKTLEEYFLILVPLFHLLFVAHSLSRHVLPRLFIPMLPLVCLFTAVVLWDSFKNKKWIIAVLAVIFFANFQTHLYPLNQPSSPYIAIEAEFEKFLPKDKNLLIAPLSVVHHHTPLSKKLYLNGRGRYLVYTTHKNFEEIFKEENISHVWVADAIDRPQEYTSSSRTLYTERIKTLYGLNPEEYDIAKDKQFVKDYLNKRGFKIVHNSNLGTVYEL